MYSLPLIDYVNSFYRQYDDLVRLYNEKFGKPGGAIMAALKKNGLTEKDFDENIEDWYLIWHTRAAARMGASMMAPDYALAACTKSPALVHEFIPEAREIVAKAKKKEATKEAEAVKRC